MLHKMADPFEVRMRFTKQLQHLNASVTATQKAAQYALRYKDMDEDLHSCIVEQLEQVYFPENSFGISFSSASTPPTVLSCKGGLALTCDLRTAT